MSGPIGLTPADGTRHHGFDAVRGLAAVAVVVLHAAYPYALLPMPGLIWTVPVDEPSRLADAVFWWIEGSVMPLFFTLSGYFLAGSLLRQAPSAVLKNRSRRLLLPMATFGFVILTLDLQVWALGLIATDRASFRHWWRMKYPPGIHEYLWGTAHLWYIEYLWLLCLIACGLAWGGSVLRRRFAAAPRRKLTPHRSGLGGGVTAVGLAAITVGVGTLLAHYPEVVLGFQHGWLPFPAKFGHAALFLSLGLLLAWCRGLPDLARRTAPFLLAAAVGIFLPLLPKIHDTLRAGRETEYDPSLGLMLGLFALTATFGQIGAGLRWLDRPRPVLAKLAAASFWIYLIHHPLLGLIQVGLRPVPVPALAKFSFATAVTMAICLVTYRWYVENRGLGRLLDGEWPWRAFRDEEPPIVRLPDPSPVRKAA